MVDLCGRPDHGTNLAETETVTVARYSSPCAEVTFLCGAGGESLTVTRGHLLGISHKGGKQKYFYSPGPVTSKFVVFIGCEEVPKEWFIAVAMQLRDEIELANHFAKCERLYGEIKYIKP